MEKFLGATPQADLAAKIVALQDENAKLRAALDEAGAALEFACARNPQTTDFVPAEHLGLKMVQDLARAQQSAAQWKTAAEIAEREVERAGRRAQRKQSAESAGAEQAMEVLRQIASMPRRTREQRLAKSCVDFLDALRAGPNACP